MRFNRKWARVLHGVSLAAGAAAVSSLVAPDSMIHDVLTPREAAGVVLVAQIVQGVLGEWQHKRNPDGTRAEFPYSAAARRRGGE